MPKIFIINHTIEFDVIVLAMSKKDALHTDFDIMDYVKDVEPEQSIIKHEVDNPSLDSELFEISDSVMEWYHDEISTESKPKRHSDEFWAPTFSMKEWRSFFITGKPAPTQQDPNQLNLFGETDAEKLPA